MSKTHRLSRRALALVASSAMIMALVPASIASADTDAVCDQVEGADYSDVDETGGTFGPFIACAGGYGIVDGYPDGSFQPGAGVTRAQAAKFVVNLIETADNGNEMPLDTSDNPFDDVDPDGTFGSFILKLYQAGIIDGKDANTFDPQGTLTRGQMSKIVALALEYLGITLDTSDHNANDDVSSSDTFGDWINALLNLHIVEGESSSSSSVSKADHSGNTFNGGGDVTRGQLAKFDMNGAGALDDEGLFNPPSTLLNTNQSFPLDPNTTETLVYVRTAGEPNATDNRQYSVSGLEDGVTYDVALIPAQNVIMDGNIVTFKDADGTGGAGNNLADGIGGTNAFISVINGGTQGTTDGMDQFQAQPVNGTIALTVDFNDVAGDGLEQIIPVVWRESDNDNALDLDADNAPTEDFGIGGQTNWIPPEAANGSDPDGNVLAFDFDAGWIVIDDAPPVTLWLHPDGPDTFEYDGQPGDFNITRSNFQMYLSASPTGAQPPADYIFVDNYARDTALGNHYDLDDDHSLPPTGLTITPTAETPSGSSAVNDAVFNWNPATGGLIASYSAVVYTNSSTANDTGVKDCNGQGPVVDTVSVSSSMSMATIENLGDGNYCGQVFSLTNDHLNEHRLSSAPSNVVFFEIDTAETGSPIISDLIITNSATPGITDSGDMIQFTFNETMSATVDDVGSYFRFEDNAGTTWQVGCGNSQQAQCMLMGHNQMDAQILWVRLWKNPLKISGSGTAALEPGTVNFVSSQWDDLAGNQLSLANSTDVTIDGS